MNSNGMDILLSDGFYSFMYYLNPRISSISNDWWNCGHVGI